MNDPLSDLNRSMPHSAEAEMGILSCFLQNPTDLLDDARENVTEEWFYHPAHRQLYGILMECADKGLPVDLVSLSKILLDKQLMDRIGGPAALPELLSFVPTPAHYPHYKGILRDKHLLRSVVKASTEAIAECYEHQDNAMSVLDRAEERIFAIRPDDNQKNESDCIADNMDLTLERIEAQIANGGKMNGYGTGYPWIDSMTGGIRTGEAWFIGARPSTGKTAFMLAMLRHISVDQRIGCGFFSLETSKDRVNRRLIAMQGDLSLKGLAQGTASREQIRGIVEASHVLRKAPIVYDDRPGLSIAQVRAKARRWVKKHHTKVIFLDFLQKMRPSGASKGNTRDDYAECSTGLSEMSRELDVAVIVLAQLNRDCERRPDGRPKLSDFEGCGRIEQDADIGMLLSRRTNGADDQRTKVLFDIAKQKDGPTGDKCHFLMHKTAMFSNIPISEDEPEPQSSPRSRPPKRLPN